MPSHTELHLDPYPRITSESLTQNNIWILSTELHLDPYPRITSGSLPQNYIWILTSDPYPCMSMFQLFSRIRIEESIEWFQHFQFFWKCFQLDWGQINLQKEKGCELEIRVYSRYHMDTAMVYLTTPQPHLCAQNMNLSALAQKGNIKWVWILNISTILLKSCPCLSLCMLKSNM